MAVTIRLTRLGKNKQPVYRLVAADKRYPRDGRFLEVLGTYTPKSKLDVNYKLNAERIQYWVKNGAQCSDVVRDILKKSKMGHPSAK